MSANEVGERVMKRQLFDEKTVVMRTVKNLMPRLKNHESAKSTSRADFNTD